MKIIFFLVIAFSCTRIVSAQFSDQLNAIGEWKASPDKKFYNQENLYDYINGASDFYLGYKFQDLWVVDYTNMHGQLVTLEIYRHLNSDCAFGIYAEERPLHSRLQKIGAEGFFESGAVYSLAGAYYMKVFNGKPAASDTALIDFAKRAGEIVGRGSELPVVLNRFPMESKIERSERYVAENFLRYEFFNEVYTCRYHEGKRQYLIFVVEMQDKDNPSVLVNYLSMVNKKTEILQGYHQVKDPRNGNVCLYYQNGSLCGAVGDFNFKKIKEVLPHLL